MCTPQVDSVLVAIDLAALHAWQHGSGSGAGSGGSREHAPLAQHNSRAETKTKVAETDQCQPPPQQQQQPPLAAWPVLPQVDFAPTLAALLGVPIPYASVGRISHDLWHLRGCTGARGAAACASRYAAALQANAWQVTVLLMVSSSALRSCMYCSAHLAWSVACVLLCTVTVPY